MVKTIYRGYHATSVENADSILSTGFIDSVTSEDNIQWLGSGIYFWLDEYYAVEWNVIKSESVDIEYINRMYTILESKIECEKDEVLDLSSPEGSIICNELMKILRNILIESGNNKVVSDLEKCTDKMKINILEEYGILEDFSVVLATYKKKNIRKNYSSDNYIEWEQRQLCVKKSNVIIETNKFEDKERCNQLLNLIINNRKKVARGRKNEKFKKIIS